MSAAFNDLNSLQFSWHYNGFGGPSSGSWGFPYFVLLNAVLAPLGFVGGVEIKVLSIVLISFAGVTAFMLGRFFRLSFFSSFLTGLFFMTSPVVFNWLLSGWVYFLIGYALLPLTILATTKFLETKDFRYLLINGLIMSVALAQPAFVLIYPFVCFLVTLLESLGNIKKFLNGVLYILGSVSIWLLTTLRFFVSYSKTGLFTVYNANNMNAIKAFFSNLVIFSNAVRFWGSTYSIQFETYFPKSLIFFSIIPLIVAMGALLLKPKDKKVLLFGILYLFVFLSSVISAHISYFAYSLPFGSVFEDPSVFLVPACLGVALLLGYTHQAVCTNMAKFTSRLLKRVNRFVPFIVILLIIVAASIPWWSLQASGTPIQGPATKLNLYSLPSGITTWQNSVDANTDYFVLYVPFQANPQIANTTYFSQTYEGVSTGIFTEVNNLPYISSTVTPQLIDNLTSGESVGKSWGLLSIRYIVIYKNIISNYNITDLTYRLSNQTGFTNVLSLPDISVFEDNFAEPVVHTDNSDAVLQIIYHNPTSYVVRANSSSPYNITLNQAYSEDWSASVNNKKSPISSHFEDINGLNSWTIDSMGVTTINIYYTPQASYVLSTIISEVTIVIIVLSICFLTIKKNNKKSRGSIL